MRSSEISRCDGWWDKTAASADCYYPPVVVTQDDGVAGGGGRTPETLGSSSARVLETKGAEAAHPHCRAPMTFSVLLPGQALF